MTVALKLNAMFWIDIQVGMRKILNYKEFSLVSIDGKFLKTGYKVNVTLKVIIPLIPIGF